jgi:hypothetical protein
MESILNDQKIQVMDQKDINIAIFAEVLFLANLLLIPIIPFLTLLYLFNKQIKNTHSIAYQHLRQALFTSILAGIFIVCIAVIFYFYSNTSAAITWTIILTYLTCIHSLFVMFGIYSLAKAMAGQTVKFPL